MFGKLKSLSRSKWIELANEVLGEYVTTDLTNDNIMEYMKDVIMMGTTEVTQLQIPISGYFRTSYDGEYSCGSSLVLTDGVSSERNLANNAEALNKFIFEYDSKKPFEYGTFINDDTGASEES